MQRNFDVGSIATLLRQTEANLSSIRKPQEPVQPYLPQETQQPWACSGGASGGLPIARAPGLNGFSGGLELEAQVMHLRSCVEGLERRVEGELRAFLGVCEKRMQAKEEQLRGLGESLNVTADSVVENISRRVDVRLRDLERAATEQGSKALEEVWETLRRLQADGRALEDRMKGCASGDEVAERVREVDRAIQQRLDERLQAHERRAAEHRAQLESGTEAWRETMAHRCSTIEQKVWEQQTDRTDVVEAIMKKLPEMAPVRELKDELKSQAYSAEVQQRRVGTCEAKLSKLTALDAKLDFIESHTAQEVANQAQECRLIGEATQKISQKVSAMEIVCQRVESQGSQLEARLQTRIEEDRSQAMSGMEALQQRLLQRVDDVEAHLQRNGLRLEREVAQQVSAMEMRSSEDAASLQRQVEGRFRELEARMDSRGAASVLQLEGIGEDLRHECQAANEAARQSLESALSDHREATLALVAKVERSAHEANSGLEALEQEAMRLAQEAAADAFKQAEQLLERQASTQQTLLDALRSDVEGGQRALESGLGALREQQRAYVIAQEAENVKMRLEGLEERVSEAHVSAERAQLGLESVKASIGNLENLRTGYAAVESKVRLVDELLRAKAQEWTAETEAAKVRADASQARASDLATTVQHLQSTVERLRIGAAGFEAKGDHARVMMSSLESQVLHIQRRIDALRSGDAGAGTSSAELPAASGADARFSVLQEAMGELRMELAVLRSDAQGANTRSSQQAVQLASAQSALEGLQEAVRALQRAQGPRSAAATPTKHQERTFQSSEEQSSRERMAGLSFLPSVSVAGGLSAFHEPEVGTMAAASTLPRPGTPPRTGMLSPAGIPLGASTLPEASVLSEVSMLPDTGMLPFAGTLPEAAIRRPEIVTRPDVVSRPGASLLPEASTLSEVSVPLDAGTLPAVSTLTAAGVVPEMAAERSLAEPEGPSTSLEAGLQPEAGMEVLGAGLSGELRATGEEGLAPGSLTSEAGANETHGNTPDGIASEADEEETPVPQPGSDTSEPRNISLPHASSLDLESRQGLDEEPASQSPSVRPVHSEHSQQSSPVVAAWERVAQALLAAAVEAAEESQQPAPAAEDEPHHGEAVVAWGRLSQALVTNAMEAVSEAAPPSAASDAARAGVLQTAGDAAREESPRTPGAGLPSPQHSSVALDAPLLSDLGRSASEVQRTQELSVASPSAEAVGTGATDRRGERTPEEVSGGDSWDGSDASGLAGRRQFPMPDDGQEEGPPEDEQARSEASSPAREGEESPPAAAAADSLLAETPGAAGQSAAGMASPGLGEASSITGPEGSPAPAESTSVSSAQLAGSPPSARTAEIPEAQAAEQSQTAAGTPSPSLLEIPHLMATSMDISASGTAPASGEATAQSPGAAASRVDVGAAEERQPASVEERPPRPTTPADDDDDPLKGLGLGSEDEEDSWEESLAEDEEGRRHFEPEEEEPEAGEEEAAMPSAGQEADEALGGAEPASQEETREAVRRALQGEASSEGEDEEEPPPPPPPVRHQDPEPEEPPAPAPPTREELRAQMGEGESSEDDHEEEAVPPPPPPVRTAPRAPPSRAALREALGEGSEEEIGEDLDETSGDAGFGPLRVGSRAAEGSLLGARGGGGSAGTSPDAGLRGAAGRSMAETASPSTLEIPQLAASSLAGSASGLAAPAADPPLSGRREPGLAADLGLEGSEDGSWDDESDGEEEPGRRRFVEEEEEAAGPQEESAAGGVARSGSGSRAEGSDEFADDDDIPL